MNRHKTIIKQGSRSFSLASLFFSYREKEACWKLYSWCRHCDDAIDEEVDMKVAMEKLTVLEGKTKALLFEDPGDFYFLGLSDVMNRFHLPLCYPLDLLRGMKMDVDGKRFRTLGELEEYCYCVAGTVGLMMCHILGIRDEMALYHAVCLGKAMQLTNIARDLSEDRSRNRLYIPLSWLTERNLEEEELFYKENRGVLLDFQERLLKRADELYLEGYEGLKFLSLRSSWAVLIAAMFYAEIGRVIRLNPKLSLKRRAVVSKPRKFLLIIRSLFKMIPLMREDARALKVRSPQSIWSLN